MHESDEASYYEIALTNRQVLVAFVVLLVCMLSSFFAGLWAGRGGQFASPPDPVAMLVQEEPGPAEDGLEEFTFFSDPKQAPEEDLAEIVADPDPETTLVEDLGGEDPPPLDREPPAAPKDGGRQVAETETAPANPAIPRGTARQAPVAAGELYVQVLSSRERRQARKVLQRLLDAGYGAFLSPIEVEDQTMYRVRIGPFSARPAAAEVAERVRQAFKLETWITS